MLKAFPRYFTLNRMGPWTVLAGTARVANNMITVHEGATRDPQNMWRINRYQKTGNGRFSRTQSHQKSKHTESTQNRHHVGAAACEYEGLCPRMRLCEQMEL